MAERRPLASRQSRWAGWAAARLAAAGIAPNRISQAGMGCAALAGLAYWGSAGAAPGPGAALLVAAALGCQVRLLCNLLDGMVAIEGGRATPDGPFWNEVPDRIADLVLLAGAGLAAGTLSLGLAAGAASVLTAYLREFGRAEGAPPDYAGPMAKPQRMAALTLGTLVCAGEVLVSGGHLSLVLTLWAVTLGTALTAWRRAARLLGQLNSRR